MNLVGAWGEADSRISLYHKRGDINRFELVQIRKAVADEYKVSVTEGEFGEFLDTILEAMENISFKTDDGYIPSTVMNAEAGPIVVGFSFSQQEPFSLVVSQMAADIAVPFERLDECLGWLLREFYLLGIKDQPIE